MGRVFLDLIEPRTHSGTYPAKAAVSQVLRIAYDAVGDPHRVLIVESEVTETGKSVRYSRLQSEGNDRYAGEIRPTEMGLMSLRARAWEDEYSKWLGGVKKKLIAGTCSVGDIADGIAMLGRRLEAHAQGMYRDLGLSFLGAGELANLSGKLGDLRAYLAKEKVVGLPPALEDVEILRLGSLPESKRAISYSPPTQVFTDRIRGIYGNWYEIFPRSVGGFAGLTKQLPRLADLGFNVIYLPPIHPIGHSGRKGKNNSLAATPTDVGSPWAIGSVEGGHDAVHPDLGSVADFETLVASTKALNMEIALDLALQCSPDHPWIRDHPEWFTVREDGSIATAENPPKRYEDIVPINFYPARDKDREALWEEIERVVQVWIEKDVRIFRVDNPHTKPLEFWHWLITRVHSRHPDVVFLAEAFTRPKIMYKLAEIGFTQSYTYFTWRNTAAEMRAYVEELSAVPLRSYFRPNFWPNTPDILSGILREGEQPAFALRVLLAATLAGSYGIYSGFEFCEGHAISEENEEYLDSEKYEIKTRDFEVGGRLDSLLLRLNHAREAYKVLQSNGNLRFLEVTNPSLLAYLRRSPGEPSVLVVVNFDPHQVQEGGVYLPAELVPPSGSLSVFDLLSEENYDWRGGHNYVRLDPARYPGHLLVVEVDGV